MVKTRWLSHVFTGKNENYLKSHTNKQIISSEHKEENRNKEEKVRKGYEEKTATWKKIQEANRFGEEHWNVEMHHQTPSCKGEITEDEWQDQGNSTFRY